MEFNNFENIVNKSADELVRKQMRPQRGLWTGVKTVSAAALLTILTSCGYPINGPVAPFYGPVAAKPVPGQDDRVQLREVATRIRRNEEAYGLLQGAYKEWGFVEHGIDVAKNAQDAYSLAWQARYSSDVNIRKYSIDLIEKIEQSKKLTQEQLDQAEKAGIKAVPENSQNQSPFNQGLSTVGDTLDMLVNPFYSPADEMDKDQVGYSKADKKLLEKDVIDDKVVSKGKGEEKQYFLVLDGNKTVKLDYDGIREHLGLRPLEAAHKLYTATVQDKKPEQISEAHLRTLYRDLSEGMLWLRFFDMESEFKYAERLYQITEGQMHKKRDSLEAQLDLDIDLKAMLDKGQELNAEQMKGLLSDQQRKNIQASYDILDFDARSEALKNYFVDTYGEKGLEVLNAAIGQKQRVLAGNIIKGVVYVGAAAATAGSAGGLGGASGKIGGGVITAPPVSKPF